MARRSLKALILALAFLTALAVGSLLPPKWAHWQDASYYEQGD
jgi:hypothetical protein